MKHKRTPDDFVAEMKVRQPRITNEGSKGWRVDFPNGDHAYQPSEDFAKACARQWRKDDAPAEEETR